MSRKAVKIGITAELFQHILFKYLEIDPNDFKVTDIVYRPDRNTYSIYLTSALFDELAEGELTPYIDLEDLGNLPFKIEVLK